MKSTVTKRRKYIRVPETEYRKLLKDLETIEDKALGKIITSSRKRGYVDTGEFLRKARQRIAKLRAAKK
jgi:hypothetical protein